MFFFVLKLALIILEPFASCGKGAFCAVFKSLNPTSFVLHFCLCVLIKTRVFQFLVLFVWLWSILPCSVQAQWCCIGWNLCYLPHDVVMLYQLKLGLPSLPCTSSWSMGQWWLQMTSLRPRLLQWCPSWLTEGVFWISFSAIAPSFHKSCRFKNILFQECSFFQFPLMFLQLV